MNGDIWWRHMATIDPLRNHRGFWIWNYIYDTNNHNTARTEQICWQLEELEISPIDLLTGRKNDLTLGHQFKKSEIYEL